MNYFDIMQEYIEKKPSIECIPVNGKAPFIESWQSIPVTSEVIDAWSDSYTGKTTGLGFRIGQYNIGCMDVDTDDVEYNYRIDEVMDLSNICTKKGKKGKTVFFRFEGVPKKSKYLLYARKGDKKPIVEFFFTTGQTVLPPSIHPETGTPYVWISQSLLDIDIEDLPIINEEKIEYLETILQANSLQDGLKQVPTAITGEGSGKWKTITSEAARLLHMGIDDSSIAKTLIGMDRRLFLGSQFFFSTKIGKDLVSQSDDFQNALMWVATYKNSLMRTDAALRKTLSNIVRVTDAVQHGGDWQPVKPLLLKEKAIHFPDHLFPDAFRSYCKDHGERSSLPPESFLTGCFTTFSAVCQARITIKATSIFSVHPSVSTMITAPSGSRKDAIFDAAVYPLDKLVENDLDKIDSNFIENEKDICLKLESLSKNKKKAIAEGDDVLRDELNKEILKYQFELTTVKKMRPNFIFESGTQEKLYEIMDQNQDRGIFLRSSEYVHLTGAMGKKGNESLRGFYLKLLNGAIKEKFVHQTKAGVNVNIRKVLGCALVGAQTDVLARDIKEMESGAQSDGLLQRFFIVSIDPEVKRMVDYDTEIDSNRICNLYALFYNLKEDFHVTWDNEETKNCYIDYDETHRNRIKNDRSAIKSFRAKYTGSAVKLSWIYEQGNMPPGKLAKSISKKSFLQAVEFLEWMNRNLEVIWSNSSYTASLRAAEAILSSIRMGGVRAINFQNDISKLTRLHGTDLESGVNLLIESNYIRIVGDTYEFNRCI